VAPYLQLTDLIDKTGYLKMLLRDCPWGHPRLVCPLKPFLRIHPDMLPPLLVDDILKKHFDCHNHA